jgi:stage II sporulation protein R
MKKICISFVIIIIIILTIFIGGKSPTQDYLRIHIRANSNSFEDQQVKYEIKDKIVEFLIPYVAQCETKKQAIAMLNKNIDGINQTADKVLMEKGFSYRANAVIREEEFPLRIYEDTCLESGIYDALIVELGEASGDNWWCVVYPPLCFSGEGEGNIEYRSKIIDIIKHFNNR